jgi:hypothetical protein
MQQRRQRQALLTRLDRLAGATERIAAHEQAQAMAREAASLTRRVLSAVTRGLDAEDALNLVLRVGQV